MSKKPKYRIYFLRKINGMMQRVKIKTLKETSSNIVEFNKKKYVIDFNSANFVSNNIFHYFLNLDKSEQFVFEKQETYLTPEELDNIVDNALVKDMTRAVAKSKESVNWMSIILGVSLGLLIGCLVMYFIMQGKIDELMNTMINPYANPIYQF